MKNWIAFNRNVLKPSAKSVLIPLGLTAAASATDAAIHKKMFRSPFTALIFSNKKMEDTGLLIKRVSETIKNEAKEQKGGFFRMLLGTLRASLLGNLLTGKVTLGAGKGKLGLVEIFNATASFN